MRPILSVMFVMILVVSSFSVSAQVFDFDTDDKISLLRGDYSEGTITIINSGSFDLRVVSYRGFSVFDRHWEQVSGFNFTLTPAVVGGWSSGEARTFNYWISCSQEVEPGNYTLRLIFLASSPDGSLSLVHVDVPLEVLRSPLKFEPAIAYVVERPDSSYAFNGDTLVIFSRVRNIGHMNVTVRALVSLSLEGKAYFSEGKTVVVEPGETLIRFEIPIGYDFPEGTYVLEYLLDGGNSTYRYSRAFQIRFGVQLIDVSLQSNRVLINETNRAYITVLSERKINMELRAKFYLANGKVFEKSELIGLSEGSNVIVMDLPTNVSGNVSGMIELTFGNRIVGTAEISYFVMVRPVTGEVVYQRLSENEVLFRVFIKNPDYDVLNAKLEYEISSGENVLYRDDVNVTLKPGINEFPFRFELPVGKPINYNFVVSTQWNTTTFSGQLYLELTERNNSDASVSPSPVSSSQHSVSNPSLPETVSISQTEGSGFPWVLLIFFGVMAVGIVYYYVGSRKNKRRRVRPKPKRRSPLGRFKRPKPPKFRENRELPKK